MKAWERKRASHVARFGAAPDSIPFVDNRGMIEILGVTQRFLGDFLQTANELSNMERYRDGLKHPSPPRGPEPRVDDPARDKRLGVRERVRPGQPSEPHRFDSIAQR